MKRPLLPTTGLALTLILLAAPALVQASERGGPATGLPVPEVDWMRRTPESSPSARDEHAMVYDDARQVAVLFGGGNDGFTGLGDTWEWDGADWLLRSPAGSPPGRQSAGMVYDTARGVTVLFGGTDDSGMLGDTWEWDGQAWVERIPASHPSARLGHAMAYDGARGVTVLWGGKDFWGPQNDTWEWDGADWVQRDPAHAPAERWSHAMAYDAAREVVVLFGGYDPESGYSLGDTWEWDGVDWAQRVSQAMPPARSSHAMAYDAARGVIVLFGGTGNSSHLNDTWQWDGADWVECTPLVAPSVRYSAAVAYDSARAVTLLFGGGYYSGGFRYLDDTWVYGASLHWTAYLPITLRVYPTAP